MAASQPPVFHVSVAWKRWNYFVANQQNPDQPLYKVQHKTLGMNLVYTRVADEEVIGTGKLHSVSINADYELHGRKGIMKATKRLKTEYNHLSYTYSDTDTPASMTWVGSCGVKNWDFVCLDENQLPVARFSTNPWAPSKVGDLEFMGPKAFDTKFQEEMVVTGITLYSCMFLRVNNIFNLAGAAIARPGTIDKEEAAAQEKGTFPHEMEAPPAQAPSTQLASAQKS